MVAFSTLSMFAIAVTMLLLSPGPNMAFVLAQGATQGARGGVAAALGIGAADIVLTVLTATGVTAVINAWPPAFDVIRYVGVLYLLHMAYQALRQRARADGAVAARISLGTVFRRSMLNSLLNPKALLFFMVFLPQFVDLSKGSVTQQLMILGGVLTLISIVFHALLGSLANVARRFVGRHPRAGQLQPYALASLLLLLALRLVLMQRPA